MKTPDCENPTSNRDRTRIDGVPRWDWGACDEIVGITTRATGEDDDGRPSGCPGVRVSGCACVGLRTDGRTDDALVWDFISFVFAFFVCAHSG